MARRLATLAILCAVPLALAAGACGSDDGTDVREVGTDGSASASGSGSACSGSGSASGSGSGSAPRAPGSRSRTRRPPGPATRPRGRRRRRVQGLRVPCRWTGRSPGRAPLTNAVRAGDLQAARAAFAPEARGVGRIEPIAGLVEEIDGAVDARVDDFAGPNDPAFTGWHRLEHPLEAQHHAGPARFANRLDGDLQTLKAELATLEVPPAAVALGASELIEEVSQGKITGEEDRFSKTDLWDFNANVEGAEEVIAALTPALQQADPELLARIEAGFDEIEASLEPLRKGAGWVLYCQENDEDPSGPVHENDRHPGADRHDEGPAREPLEDLALVPGALGLS